ncbi:MAG TPA: hypothetical protein PK014_00475 [Thermoanaerobaculia bacterium]|nr:hypothetical protein [Thermoanaerobaculia bacterium]HXK66946.1 hypothetical protein [Thermoanaerobaculia bacterium]
MNSAGLIGAILIISGSLMALPAADGGTSQKKSGTQQSSVSEQNPVGLQNGHRTGPQDCSGNMHGKHEGAASAQKNKGKGAGQASLKGKAYRSGPQDGSGKRHRAGKKGKVQGAPAVQPNNSSGNQPKSQ